MIEKIVSSGFKTDVPIPINPLVSPRGKIYTNLNPQCGPFPFNKIYYQYIPDDNFALFNSRLTDDFIQAQIIPRGRPHFSLLHIALIDDAIASSSFTLAIEENYGKNYRYIEFGAVVGFHREAFIAGRLAKNQLGTIFVDGFNIRWQCLPRKDNISIAQRGVLQVSILGLKGNEEIPVASVECEYYKRKGVVQIN